LKERRDDPRTEMKLQVSHYSRVATAMLCKATPKISDRVDELVGNIQKEVFDVRFDLWVHESEVLDRPTYVRITRC